MLGRLGARLGQRCCGRLLRLFARNRARQLSPLTWAPHGARHPTSRARRAGGEALGGAAGRQSRPQSAFRACLPGTFRQLHAGLPQGIHSSARVIIIHHQLSQSPITIHRDTIANLADGPGTIFQFFTHLTVATVRHCTCRDSDKYVCIVPQLHFMTSSVPFPFALLLT